MPVTLTQPLHGQAALTQYTGPDEAWLLAEGYAKQDGYAGPGVAETGPASVAPAQDPTRPENREDPGESLDFDMGGVDTEPPTILSIEPDGGPVAGGTEVTILGDDLTGATAVTFGGTAATSFTLEDDNTIVAVAPAHAAGTVNVVVTDPNGTDTEVGGFIYA